MWHRCPTRGFVPGVAASLSAQGRLLNAGPMFMHVVIVLASMLLLMLTQRVFAQESQNEPMLTIAVGDPGSPSHVVGLCLTSLLRAGALSDGTKMRVEIWESLSPSERVVVLFEEAQLAVVPAGSRELQKPRARQQVRAAVGLADGNQVLVRADLSDDFVYDLTRLAFEYSYLIRSIYPEVGDLEPNASLVRIEGSVHPGALRFYEEHTEWQAAAAESPTTDLPSIADLLAAAAPTALGTKARIPPSPLTSTPPSWI